MSSPPPLYNVVASNDNAFVASSSSTQNLNPSILTLFLVLFLTLIIFSSLSLLLRYLSRRSSSSSNVHDDVSTLVNSQRYNPRDDQSFFDSLPLFTFDSVTARNSSSGGDCAICLSKFEPHDQLRLLPICCHAFHVRCVDTWLQSNQTCPLCRSPIYASESELLNKVLATSAGGDSFRIEIGNISRRQALSDSGEPRRSYSIGSFDYVVEDESEVSVMCTHVRGVSDCTYGEKDENETQASEEVAEPTLAAEVAAGRSWLKEYVDRLSVSLSSGARSFRSSGRFFTGSSRRSEISGAGDCDLEVNRIGEEISELFRWFSGV